MVSRAKEQDGEPAPYRDLALIYDDLVGNTAFECWKENFEQIENRYGFSFELAADVACGTGQAADYLAGRCLRVYAVDRSARMLEAARRRNDSGKVVFLEQSFDSMELPEPVDLLTCNFDSLNYITEEGELAEALRRFYLALKPEGHAVFDMNTTRELAGEWGTHVGLHRTPGGLSIWESCWDGGTRTNTLRMTNFINVKENTYRMSEEVHRERSYDTDLVLGLLKAAGFAWSAALDAKGLTAVSQETRRVQFIAGMGSDV